MNLSKFFQAGTLAGVGLVAISLPGQASVLQLGSDGCFTGGSCSGAFTGGTYTGTITDSGSLPINVPRGDDEDLIMGDIPNETSSVNFVFTPDPNFRLTKIELFEPATFGGFTDVDDQWTATLNGAQWTAFATDGNNTLDGGDIGTSTAMWTGTNPLATVRSADAIWSLTWTGLESGPLSLDLIYENLNGSINNADALRIHVEGVFRPVIVSAPEPSSFLGIVAIAGCSALLKRKKKES